MTDDLERMARGVIACAYGEGAQGFAGCVMFARDGRSPSDMRIRTDNLRERYGTEQPLIAIDQEGGRVARLVRDAEILPPMMALGAAGDQILARQAGASIAHDLRRAGVTVDFAPVLDLALDSNNTVIGTRAFGSDPALVTGMGRALAFGLRDGGIHPTFKHLPGHGATPVDSHQDLPRVREPLEVLRERDFVPFAALSRDPGAMMSAHVVVEALDDRPASLSAAVVTRLLRDEWGFEGVLFSDCLQMGAVSGLGVQEAVVSAIAAGNDCAIVSHDLDLARDAAAQIVAAVTNGSLAFDRLRTAFERVRALRRMGAPPLPLDALPPHPGIGGMIARRAMTCVRGDVRVGAGVAHVVSFDGNSYDGVGDAPAAADVWNVPAHAYSLCSLDPPADEIDAVIDSVREGARLVILARRAHLFSGQARAIARLLDRDPDAVVVSVREPFDIPSFGRAAHVLAAYGDDAASLGAAAGVIFNGAPAPGRLPVVL